MKKKQKKKKEEEGVVAPLLFTASLRFITHSPCAMSWRNSRPKLSRSGEALAFDHVTSDSHLRMI
jgi:hypothetical protein